MLWLPGGNVLYERFFAATVALGARGNRYPWKDKLQERIWAFLQRAQEWRRRDGALARLKRIGRQSFTPEAATLSRPRMSDASRARTMSAMQAK